MVSRRIGESIESYKKRVSCANADWHIKRKIALTKRPLTQYNQYQLREKKLRKCTVCKEIKSLEEFYLDRNKRYRCRCKRCLKELAHNYYLNHKDKKIAYQRQFYAKNSKYYTQYEYNRNPHYRAFRTFAQFFSLESECLLCGGNNRLQRHHPRYFDYNLECAWIFATLCSPCHHKEDRHREEWIVEEVLGE